MPKYIKKKALKSAIECCTWYHINKNGELVEGANPAEHEPLYKYSDIKKIIKGLPTRKFDDEPTAEDSSEVEWVYNKRERLWYPYSNGELLFKDKPTTQTETQNSNLTFEKDECAKEYEELGLKELKELIEADRKTENSSEKPNNCKYAENPSGDVWECGCFLDTYCEHQIYDRNPDGTINIVECGYKPKDEPQTERSSE